MGRTTRGSADRHPRGSDRSALSSRQSRVRLEVVRPPVPVHLYAFIFLALGLTLGYSFVLKVPLPPEYWLPVTAAAACSSVVVPVLSAGGSRIWGGRRRGPRWSWRRAVIVGSLVLGCAVGVADATEYREDWSLFSQFRFRRLGVDITEGSSKDAFGRRAARGEIELASGRRVTVDVVHDDGGDYQFGQHISVAARPSARSAIRTRDISRRAVGRVVVSRRQAESAQIGWREGATGFLARIRSRLLDSVMRQDGRVEGKALLVGLLLGDRSRVRDSGLEQPFRAAGVSHILSVSGSHLAVVASAVMVATRAAGLTRPAASAVVVVVAMSFTLMTGGDPATVRAWCMLLVAAVVHWGGRRTDGLAAVSAAGIGILLAQSGLVFSVGFWLSVSAVVGLVTFTRYVGRWLQAQSTTGVSLRGVTTALAATIAAQVSTMPIATVVFGTVSVVAPLANLVVVPLTSIALVAGLVGAIQEFVGLGADSSLSVSVTIAGWAVGAASAMSSIPGAEVAVGDGMGRWALAAITAVSVVGLYVWWPRPRSLNRLGALGAEERVPGDPWALRVRLPAVTRWLVLGATCVLIAALWFAPSWGPRSRVVFLDVGQGDAVLVQSRGRSTLIDGGPDESALRWELFMAGCFRVDAVVATHDHDDHVAGMGSLSGQLGGPPQVLYCASGAERSAALQRVARAYGRPLRQLAHGQSFGVGDIEVRAIGPTTHVRDPGANDSCLILDIRRVDGERGVRSSGGVLVGGDAEAQATLSAITASQSGGVSVLKVGHHGSADALSTRLLEATTPELAVISVGEENRYGHPAAETTELLRRYGVPVRRTDTDGRIAVQL